MVASVVRELLFEPEFLHFAGFEDQRWGVCVVLEQLGRTLAIPSEVKSAEEVTPIVGPSPSDCTPQILIDMEKLKQIIIIDHFINEFQTHVMQHPSCLQQLFLSFSADLGHCSVGPVLVSFATCPIECWLIVIPKL